jgi:hypothetical protein
VVMSNPTLVSEPDGTAHEFAHVGRPWVYLASPRDAITADRTPDGLARTRLRREEYRLAEVRSLADRLLGQLDEIERAMLELVDCSTIEEFRNDPYSGVVVVVPPHYWGKPDAAQQRLQMQLNKLYAPWIEMVRYLLAPASQEVHQEIKRLDTFLVGWIEKKWDLVRPRATDDRRSERHGPQRVRSVPEGDPSGTTRWFG